MRPALTSVKGWDLHKHNSIDHQIWTVIKSRGICLFETKREAIMTFLLS